MSIPTRRDLGAALVDIFYVLKQTNVGFIGLGLRAKLAPHFPLPVEVSNACVEASLINLRAIDGFFAPKKQKGHETDIIAKDYGYSGGQPFLTKDERTQINRRLAHLSWDRISVTKKAWQAPSMVLRARKEMLTFIKFLETNLANPSDDEIEEIKDARRFL